MILFPLDCPVQLFYLPVARGSELGRVSKVAGSFRLRTGGYVCSPCSLGYIFRHDVFVAMLAGQDIFSHQPEVLMLLLLGDTDGAIAQVVDI